MSGEPRYHRSPNGRAFMCQDCGAYVVATDAQHEEAEAAHTRFHAILSQHARLLAVLYTGHIGANPHARLLEQSISTRVERNENNWSAEAFEEVTGIPNPEGTT